MSTDAVNLSSSRDDWPERFASASAWLFVALGTQFAVEHIGSTSVPGLSATDWPEPSARSRAKYAPSAAQKRAELRARRPKASKFDHLDLASLVQERWCVKWSPEQISNHLATAVPDRQEMQVSPETIYQALYEWNLGIRCCHPPVQLR